MVSKIFFAQNSLIFREKASRKMRGERRRRRTEAIAERYAFHSSAKSFCSWDIMNVPCLLLSFREPLLSNHILLSQDLPFERKTLMSKLIKKLFYYDSRISEASIQTNARKDVFLKSLAKFPEKTTKEIIY